MHIGSTRENKGKQGTAPTSWWRVMGSVLLTTHDDHGAGRLVDTHLPGATKGQAPLLKNDTRRLDMRMSIPRHIVRIVLRIVASLAMGAALTALLSIWVARDHLVNWKSGPFKDKSIYDLSHERTTYGSHVSSRGLVWGIESLKSTGITVVIGDLSVRGQPASRANENDKERSDVSQMQLSLDVEDPGGSSAESPLPYWSMLPAVEHGTQAADQIVEFAEAKRWVLLFEYASGWPFRAMRSGEVVTIEEDWLTRSTFVYPPPADRVVVATPEVWLSRDECTFSLWDTQSTCRLPVVPIIPGFIANSLLYGAIVYGLFWLLSSTYRGVRSVQLRRSGRCVNCGYCLSGLSSGGCPECGQRLVK